MKVSEVILIAFLCVINVVYSQTDNKTQPHIVLIVADDMGWNDASFHGANQIPTPNIDALAYNGIILNRFYTLPSCTPSRTALLTGQYPFRLGLQGIPIVAGENRHLPLHITTLPERLKELGYTTKLVGKWHLGSAYRNVTPTNRGFDYHFGYWHGYVGYFNHEARGNDMYGLDMHENFEPMWSTQNEYATNLLTRKTEEVIEAHDKSKPLFLMVSHLAPHAGKGGNDLEVPDVDGNNKKFNYIQNEKRRLYAGMIDELDKSIGKTVAALSKHGMLDNTLILFFSDNGAQTVGVHENLGSNWPLRGMKFTILEGGVRNIAVIYSSQLKNRGTVNNELVHIADLLPTFYAAAGGDVSKLGKIDGINQWPTLTANQRSSRTKILLTIDEVNNSSGILGYNGRYKLINGSAVFDKSYDNFYGEDGRDSFAPSYNITAVLESDVNLAIRENLSENKILQLREESDLGNCRNMLEEHHPCTINMCLFDILNDPCETRNVAAQHPEIVTKLSQELSEYWKQVYPQKIATVDPRANPVHFNNSWYTWLED